MKKTWTSGTYYVFRRQDGLFLKRTWPEKKTTAGWTKNLAEADLFDQPSGFDWDPAWSEIVKDSSPVRVTYRMLKEVVLAAL